VVFAIRDYAVLKREFSYPGVGNPAGRALDMFEIGRPDLDWVQLARGLGSARRARRFLGKLRKGSAGWILEPRWKPH
jgi:acetolactate synthase I/II/III large subunit